MQLWWEISMHTAHSCFALWSILSRSGVLDSLTSDHTFDSWFDSIYILKSASSISPKLICIPTANNNIHITCYHHEYIGCLQMYFPPYDAADTVAMATHMWYQDKVPLANLLQLVVGDRPWVYLRATSCRWCNFCCKTWYTGQLLLRNWVVQQKLLRVP